MDSSKLGSLLSTLFDTLLVTSLGTSSSLLCSGKVSKLTAKFNAFSLTELKWMDSSKLGSLLSTLFDTLLVTSGTRLLKLDCGTV